MTRKKQANPHMRTLEVTLSSVYGWAVNPSMRTTVQAVVSRKAERLGLDEMTYCRLAAQSPGELHSVAEEIALGETCFFREPEQYASLRTHIFPDLIRRCRTERKLRLWSAGCSSGEEPYSLAIVLEEFGGELEGWRVEILAVDLRSRALLEASQGRYHPLQLRHLDQPVRERFFPGSHAPDAPPAELDRRLRRTVKFRHANLFDPHLWQHLPGQFDLIVCSNVITHLHHAAIQQTLTRIHQALKPHGYLMVGISEATLAAHPKLRVVNSLPPGFFMNEK